MKNNKIIAYILKNKILILISLILLILTVSLTIHVLSEKKQQNLFNNEKVIDNTKEEEVVVEYENSNQEENDIDIKEEVSNTSKNTSSTKTNIKEDNDSTSANTMYYCQKSWELKGDKCYQETGYYEKKVYSYSCPTGYIDVTMNNTQERRCAKEEKVNVCNTDQGRYFNSTGLCHKIDYSEYTQKIYCDTYCDSYVSGLCIATKSMCYSINGETPAITDGDYACGGYDSYYFDTSGYFVCTKYEDISKTFTNTCKTGYIIDSSKEQEDYIYCTYTKVKDAYIKG